MGEEELSQDTGTQEVVDTQGQDQGQGTGINPAWNELLNSIPSQLHSIVTPHLQQWDKNYQEGIGKVHSQYESFKPFVDQGVTADQINYGLQLLDAFESRPQDIFAAMQQAFGEQQQEEVDPTQNFDEQGQESTPIDISQHPQFQELAGMVNTMAQLLVQQSTQEMESQADGELEAEFAAAKQEVGDFDEKWVLVQMMANENLTVKDAAQQYQQFVKGLLTENNRPGPRVLSPGGSTPNPGVTPSQLDDKGRRSLVAQMLAEAQQNAG